MMPLRMSTFDNLTDESQGTQGIIISLACVSSETHNLQRVFRPPPPGGGGSSFYRLYRYVPR